MRKSKGFQSISSSLNQDVYFNDIIKRAEKIRQLNAHLQKTLPAPVQGMCQLANIRGETAILTCKTQMEASKLRMYSRSILQTMQKEFKTSIKKIRIKVSI
ncbi:MAG: DUF721 domain-containing protein [Proteobacteria bacterium]|nr:DUF721 domain-containing protein [Pseudomonadota bacterium]